MPLLPPRPGGPKSDHHRALELLASTPDGRAGVDLLACGFTTEVIFELVRAGLATAEAERLVTGTRGLEIARLRITDAGRRAIRRVR